MAFSPGGRLALSGDGDDSSVRLWDTETGEEMHRYPGHIRGAAGVAFSPDGRRALTGDADGTVRLSRVGE